MKTHTLNGERHCPNKNASFAEKMALISSKKAKESTPHQIAAVATSSDTDEQDLGALEELKDEEAEIVKWTIEEYLEGLSDVDYPPTSDTLHHANINTVELIADTSSPKRVHVALILNGGMDIRIPIMGFFDTGSMTNLIDQDFAERHQLKLVKKKLPLKTSGFNGIAGEDIWWEWNEKVEAVGLDGMTEVYDISLNVTRLAGHEVIIGYPWMKKVGCTVVMKETGTFVNLGHMLVAAVSEMSSSRVDCELRSPHSSDSPFSSLLPTVSDSTVPTSSTHHIMNTNVKDATSSPFQIMISKISSTVLRGICTRYSHIFFAQDSVLPPHRSFDISIEIKDKCEAPFGGLYNLALNEQIELKTYLNDLLKKGFIRPSKSAAAAPIFFVKVPGKKNRPCVDYRGLNKVSKRDSYPIPVMSWLLNQLEG